jgi:predicted choloylglycine hydrolase
LNFTYKTVAEPTKAGAKWQQLFLASWPNYRSWLHASEFGQHLSLADRESALLKYMPKMWETYTQLCSLVHTEDKELAHSFLTGYCPPAYLGGCAQAVVRKEEIQLVRNYDYHPNLLEGTLLLSKWNNQKVIATSDCIIGALDGMNESGLCVSLTFGGRKQVGLGFGIPFILRYVLEFCHTTQEAIDQLSNIPSHMSYNVTVVDKTGDHKTIMLAPDRMPVITNEAFATNHQRKVSWPENAAFNQTIKRANFIKSLLHSDHISGAQLTKAFLHPPLYNTTFKEGFGTLYTAVYKPESLSVQILWPQQTIIRSFDFFVEEIIPIYFQQSNQSVTQDEKHNLEQIFAHSDNWQYAVVDSLVSTFASKSPIKQQEKLRSICSA